MPHNPAGTVGEGAARVLGEMVMHATHQFEDLLPAEARIHLIRAQRELLLAAIAALEHHQPADPVPPRTRRVRKIPLD
ncbi:MAG: hypothetical protein ACYCYK_07465 [Candidatus Dormibacteria bacterium]